MKDHGHWINGVEIAAEAGEWIESHDPYRGRVWARVARGTTADADKAVRAAKNAMTTGPWATMSATQRGKILRRVGDAALAHIESLAEIEVRDNGKLIGDIKAGLNFKSDIWTVRRRMIWNIRGDFGAEVIGSSGLGYAA